MLIEIKWVNLAHHYLFGFCLCFLILYKYWLHERVTWDISENQCRRRRSRGWNWFLRCDNFQCYPFVQSIIIILYWILIKYIVYITFGFRTPHIQTLVRCQSEFMVKRMRITSAQSMFFGISPVVKQYHPLPRSITC